VEAHKKSFCLALVLGASLWFAGFAGAAELKLNTQDFAPFNYEVNGVVSGPAADIIRKICGEMKIDCSLHHFPGDVLRTRLPTARPMACSLSAGMRNGLRHCIFPLPY
jgi:hypothetical protein